jgi:hypothetical protein
MNGMLRAPRTRWCRAPAAPTPPQIGSYRLSCNIVKSYFGGKAPIPTRTRVQQAPGVAVGLPDPQPHAGTGYPAAWHEFRSWFPDGATCRFYLVRLRWPTGVVRTLLLADRTEVRLELAERHPQPAPGGAVADGAVEPEAQPRGRRLRSPGHVRGEHEPAAVDRNRQERSH